MPTYVCMAVSDIPVEGQVVTGPIYRITAADQTTALQQFAAQLGQRSTTVMGVTLAANITRVTVTPGTTTYTVT
jgi:hypothetical protein